MKKGSLFITLGLLLLAAALCFIGYNVWDNHRAGTEAEIALEELKPLIEENAAKEEVRRSETKPSETEIPDYILNPYMEPPKIDLDGDIYVGLLEIPALGIELPVFDEWSYENLRSAPCRYVGSPYTDDMVLCAHNYDIHFGQIKNLSQNDTVIFTDTDGNVFTYRVLEILILEPDMIKEMTDSTEWDLTLFTCTIGGATRVTVRCERVTEALKLK